MEIKISRHAKRRAKLYNISEALIKDIFAGLNVQQGAHEILREVGLKYPLKIVFKVDADAVTIITAYPLKKGRKK